MSLFDGIFILSVLGTSVVGAGTTPLLAPIALIVRLAWGRDPGASA